MYELNGHGVHVSAVPTSEVKVPSAQGKHSPNPLVEYVPAVQELHAADICKLNLPALHGAQLLALRPLPAVTYVPGLQGLHFERSASVYCPSAQSVHVRTASSVYFPGAHRLQSSEELPLPAGTDLPAGHCEQDSGETPAPEATYLPATQSVWKFTPSAAYLPAVVSAQPETPFSYFPAGQTTHDAELNPRPDPTL